MRIAFDVGEKKVEFRRNWLTGSTTFVVDGITKPLSDFLDLSTHFSVAHVKTWRLTLFGHQVEVKKTRPALFAGFRPQNYVVSVDGTAVAERTGY